MICSSQCHPFQHPWQHPLHWPSRLDWRLSCPAVCARATSARMLLYAFATHPEGGTHWAGACLALASSSAEASSPGLTRTLAITSRRVKAKDVHSLQHLLLSSSPGSALGWHPCPVCWQTCRQICSSGTTILSLRKLSGRPAAKRLQAPAVLCMQQTHGICSSL